LSETAIPETVTATVEFALDGATVKSRLTVPTGPTLASELVDTCRSLTDVILEVAVHQANERGEQVSCRPGCGACCRQVVPVSEPEAHRLAAHIEQMEEPRRSTIRQRFADARDRLEEAGLLEQLLDTDQFPYTDVQRFGTEYFRLGIPCPFLENESCSIYDERPLSCREFLVTSPAENCRNPSPETVRVLPLSARLSNALCRVNLKPESKHGRWAPLILVPEWAKARPAEVCEKNGPELLEELFTRLSETAPKG
jgi:Fe-S-cluster containining protein